MEKKWVVLVVVVMICFSGLIARCQQRGQCPEFDKFTQRYGVATAGKFGQKIADCQNNPNCLHALSHFKYDHTGMIEELPGVWIKGSLASYGFDVSRVINARRLQNCINLHGLYLLAVAAKCVERVGQEWKVFAEDIRGSSFRISVDLIQQLVLLAEETGFRDWDNNWLWDATQGKLICIDTEDNSFLVGKYRGLQGREDVPDHCIFHYVASLLVWQDYMEPEAQQCFYKRLHKLSKSPAALSPVTPVDYPLAWNAKYDDPAEGIDFQKVKAEYIGQ